MIISEMQELINSIKTSFPKYHKDVNNVYRQKTANWNKLFSGDYSSDIYRGLLYIINEFLNGEKKQLFIQFPTEKLGRTDSLQKANREHLQEIIADILCLTTKQQWGPQLACPDIDSTSIGDFYYSEITSQESSTSGKSSQQEGIIWEIKSSHSYPARPSTNHKSYNNLRTSDARNMFNASRANGIKLSCVSNVSIIPPRRIKDWGDRINLYRELPAIYSSSTCIMVGRNQYWKDQPIDTGIFADLITFVSDYQTVKDQACDILVLLWDKKYLDYERDILNAVASGKIKKVIYLGTQIFDGFKKESSNVCFPFTYRELYAYFDSTESGRSQFPQFEYRKIAFPSLIEKVSELETIIPTQLEDLDKKRIIRYCLYPFLCLTYSLPQIDRLRMFLWENFEAMSPDEIDEIINWVSKVSFSGRSPKEQENQSITSDKQKFYISPIESYKDRLNSYLKKTNSNRQIYIIDALVNDKRYIDIIKSLLERGCRGTFYVLSYFELPYLKRFFEEEVSIYKNEVRSKYLDIEFDLTIAESPVSNNLLDYYDATSDDLSLIFTPQQPVKHLTYTCSFADCLETSVVDGDVIYYSETKSIDELYNNKDEYLPCTITYYKTPADFQYLMEVYFNFPKGQNVESFSRLWKCRMQELLKSKYNGDVAIMWEDFRFLKIEKLKAIVRGKYKNLFPDEIGQIASALNKMEVISIDEMRLIRSADSVVGKHSAKAKDLKSSLIQYLLTGTINGFLNMLISNGVAHGEQWSADTIAKRIMLTHTLNDVELNK